LLCSHSLPGVPRSILIRTYNARCKLVVTSSRSRSKYAAIDCAMEPDLEGDACRPYRDGQDDPLLHRLRTALVTNRCFQNILAQGIPRRLDQDATGAAPNEGGSNPAPGRTGAYRWCTTVAEAQQEISGQGARDGRTGDGEWCEHCRPGHGCAIYKSRPMACRNYEPSRSG
jgi:hypothetical protein